MKLDGRWRKMVKEDPQLLVELMAQRIESEEDDPVSGFVDYVLELLNPVMRTTLIQDSYELFKEDK